MKIFVDEDLSDGVLVSLLQKAGHDVESVHGTGRFGLSDPIQFTFAIHQGRVCLSANYEDFEELHLLVKEAKGQHPGVLVVRQDNNPSRDLTPKGIVTAIRKLEAAAVPIANEYIIVNHWR